MKIETPWSTEVLKVLQLPLAESYLKNGMRQCSLASAACAEGIEELAKKARFDGDNSEQR